MKSLIVIIICFLIILSTSNSQYSARNVVYAKNIVYADVASLFIFLGTFSLNYERHLTKNISLRFGVGQGLSIFEDLDDLPRPSGLIMCNYITSGEHKFEIGLGFTIPFSGNAEYKLLLIPFNENLGRQILSASLGYRYQKKDGGLFFRAGASCVYLYGVGTHFSLGYAF